MCETAEVKFLKLVYVLASFASAAGFSFLVLFQFSYKIVFLLLHTRDKIDSQHHINQELEEKLLLEFISSKTLNFKIHFYTLH